MRSFLERAVLWSLLLLSIGSFTVLFLGSGLHERGLEEGAAQTNVGLRALEALVYAGCAGLMLFRWKRMLRWARAGWPLLALALLAVASTAWSVDPGTTLRRSSYFLVTTAFGIYLGGRYTLGLFQKRLLQFFLFVIAASILLWLAKPSYAVDTFHGTAFRGITEHKNLFGEYMGTFFFLALTYRFRSGYARLGTIAVAAGALLLSHASTALIAAGVTLALLPVLWIFRFRPRQALPLLVAGSLIVGALGFAAYRNSDTLLLSLGKDTTLTGRAEIWSYVLQSIGRRPLLGYGYDAFWQGLKGESLLLTAQVGWEVPHSHNGYLEVALALGTAGLSLFVLCALRLLRGSILYLRRRGGMLGLWPALFLLYYLLHATAEASLLVRDGLSYLVFAAISTSVVLDRRASQAIQEAAKRPAAPLLEAAHSG